MEDKLLNKIKLIISPYLARGEYGNDFTSGKVSMAKEISDAIDFVNDKNLQLSNIENGEVVFDDVLTGIPGMRGFVAGNDGLYLRLNGDCVDMHLKTIPFVPEEGKDDCAGAFRVIVQKVETPKKFNKAKRAKKQKEDVPQNIVEQYEGLYRQMKDAQERANNANFQWYIPNIDDIRFAPAGENAAEVNFEANI